MTPDENHFALSPELFWFALLAFLVVTAIWALIGLAREKRAAKIARRATAEAFWARILADPKPVRVHPHCGTWGHKYVAHQTVWLCGVCGDRIPRDTLLLEEEDIA